MPQGERYSDENSIECRVCDTSLTVYGEPLVFIGTHLPIHDMSYADYLRQFPDAFTHSASYRKNRQEAAAVSSGQKWEDILSAFNQAGFLSVRDLAVLFDTSRESINAIISQESKKPKDQQRMMPDGQGMLVNEETGKIGKTFYLFSLAKALDIKRSMNGSKK